MFFFLLVLSSCFSVKEDKSVFVYCSEGSPSAFNPQVTSDGTSNNASAYTIYNRLLGFKKGTTQIIPKLATSWSVSEDGKTYTFNLRQGVKFHTSKYFTPSRNFNADDVLFSFNRMYDKSHPFHKVGGGSYEYFNGMGMRKLIKEINKKNDYQVEIVLNRAEAPFIANITMSFMSIISKEYGELLIRNKEQDQIDHLPIGTGPFKFVSYLKDNVIKYKANKDYFLSVPKIEKLVFAITPESSVRYQKLKVGECHLIIYPSPSDLKAIEANKELTLMKSYGFNISYLAMNTKKAPFDNLKVRKAINMALNKSLYIRAIFLDRAEVAKNPLPPTIWSYNKDVVDYSYNIENAKKLLQEAGHPNGFKTSIWTLPVARPYNPNGKKMGELMQADLAKIGIEVKLLTFDWPTYLDKARKGEHEMIQFGWTGDNGDPDNFLHVLLGCSAVEAGSNVARWCNKEFNDLIMKAKVVSDVKLRASFYKKAQVIFKQEAPWVPLVHSETFRAMKSNVIGYIMDPLGGDIFDEVSFK